MAIAYVQSASGSSSFGSTVTAAFGSDNTAGNLLVCGINTSGNSGSVTDTNNTPVDSGLNPQNGGADLELWYVPDCAAGANTMSVDVDGFGGVMTVGEYSGIETASPLDKTASDTGFGTTASSGATAETAQADELLIGVAGAESSRTFVAGSSFTERQDLMTGASTNPVSLNDRIVASAAAYTFTATVSSSANWAALIATFKGAAAGGTTVTPTTLALTLSTFAPTVSTPRLVTPTTLALTISAFAPTVSTPRLVTPATLALTISAFAPTVSTPRLVTPTTLALTLSTFAPTVSTPRLVTPTTLALTISAFAPTVSTPLLVTPTTLALTISAFAPTVSTPRLVTPTTLALTISAFAPTVTASSAGSVTVTPSTAALTLTTYAAVVSATWTIVRVLVVPAPIRSVTLVAARRTVVVPAIAMPTLTRGRPMYRVSEMHPSDVRDLTWTLTPLLGAGETVSTAEVIVTEGNVEAAAADLAGAVVTSRITADLAAIGETAVVTCRFTTSLGRQLDVSYYFTIAARGLLLDQLDPHDTDTITFNWSRLLEAGGQAIDDADAVVDAGALTLASVTFAGENSVATISGGTLGALAQLRGQITLDDGQIENFTARLPIGQN